MGALSLSKSATLFVFDISEWMLLVFGILLVMGLIGERKTDKRSTICHKRWYRRFELFVIIGVVGELLGDGGIFFSSRKLQAISDLEVARLNLSTEQLKASNLKLEKDNAFLKAQATMNSGGTL